MKQAVVLALTVALTGALSLAGGMIATTWADPVLKLDPAPQATSTTPSGRPLTINDLPPLPTQPRQARPAPAPKTTNTLPDAVGPINALSIESQPPSLPNEDSSPNTALKLGTGAKRVPAGTLLRINFNTALDSKLTNVGEPFTATLADDFTSVEDGHTHIILPAGTVVRGRVDSVQRPSFFSKGGAIFLTFDHIVLPSGDLLPLDLKLSTNNVKVNKQGALYQDPGIPVKLRKSLDKGVGTIEKITQTGIDAGKNMADGLGTVVTVPLAAIGGVLAGTAVTAGNGAVAVVGKGESVVIAPGDSATIDFGGSFNLPSE